MQRAERQKQRSPSIFRPPSIKLDVMNTETKNPYDQNRADRTSRQLQAHFLIYENLAYVRDRRFTKDRISIGSSPRADVVLDHQSVANIHAWVHCEGGQAFLINKYPNDGLRLNGRSVNKEALQPEDVIDIGPFSLKIKMALMASTLSPASDVTYAVRLVNRYDSPEKRHAAARRLSRLLRVDTDRVLPLIEKDFFLIKKELSGLDATRWQNTLLKAGIICDVQIEADLPQAPSNLLLEATAPADETPQALTQSTVGSGSEKENQKVRFINLKQLVADEEDDEDEIWEAPFTLRNRLSSGPPKGQTAQQMPVLVQVVKSIGDSVVDVAHLPKGKKYYLDKGLGRICLVRHSRRQQPEVCITPELGGFVQNERGEATADLDSYKTEAYQARRGKSLYHVPLPENGALVVSNGGCCYRISMTRSMPSPEVAVTVPGRSITWRHWAWSGGVHIFFLVCLSVYIYLQAVTPKTQELRFVKIDPSMLIQPEPKKAPPPEPKKEPPPPKPEPRQVAQKVEPAKQKPRPQKVKPTMRASKPQKSSRRVASAGQPSKHPKAGGGFGEGNIKNRNINQAGILSVLGGSSLGGPTEAIAAVTNLDAVPVPGASEKNFTVGGLKGSLGNGKISVASGGIVQTKGSTQVLRSAGASGKGEVAALERGSIGKKKVQAMVTAKMSRTVKIEGGMSREMVKRVIDQHLDEITYCYETALMSNPSILGRIVFEWKILMDGRVGEIRIVASSVNSHEIHDCIQSAIKSWQFPKPVGAEVVVSYPFVFDLVAF